VPLLVSGRCVAALKIVCPPDTRTERFDACVKVLDALVRDYATRNAEFLSEAVRPELQDTEDASEALDQPTQTANNHRQIIQRAVEYIEAKLADPRLSVADVARHLGLHADYLSNCFVRRTGQRMTYYIADRRTERAKNLLVATRWTIKRIAERCGFANTNWFSHVFRTHAGMTPGEFRKADSSKATAPTKEILDSLSIS
jgi:AraC-like DNA-binding protein